MAEILNLKATHDEGQPQLQIGIRNRAFVMRYDTVNHTIKFFDANTGEPIAIDSSCVPSVRVMTSDPDSNTPGKNGDVIVVVEEE